MIINLLFAVGSKNKAKCNLSLAFVCEMVYYIWLNISTTSVMSGVFGYHLLLATVQHSESTASK